MIIHACLDKTDGEKLRGQLFVTMNSEFEYQNDDSYINSYWHNFPIYRSKFINATVQELLYYHVVKAYI